MTRARAEVETWPRLRCRVLEAAPEGRSKEWDASFYAFSARPPYVEFFAKRLAKGQRGRRVLFEAGTADRRGNLSIYRSAVARADLPAFRVPDWTSNPENIVLTPPPPFSGTGTLTRTTESTFAWEGDLSFQTTGIAPTPLTGPNFETRLCALRGCVHQSAAERGEPALIVPAS